MKTNYITKIDKRVFLPYKVFEVESEREKKTRNRRIESALLYPNRSSPSFKEIHRTKETLFNVEKKIKRITLSSKDFTKYINKYTRFTQDFCFKSPNIQVYPFRKNSKYLPIYKKQSTSNKKNSFEFIIENKKNEGIERTDYGYKYKDTKIKCNLEYKNNSAISMKDMKDSFSYQTYINIKNNNKKEKKKVKNDNMNNNDESKNNKSEKTPNEIFKYFFDGDFLLNNSRSNIFLNEKKSSKDNEINKNLVFNESDFETAKFLNEYMKNINYFDDSNYIKNSNFSIKNNFPLSSKYSGFFFELTICSMCLKFKENSEIKRILLPFEFLAMFYMLDFQLFKLFLSEIIHYDKESKSLAINNEEVMSKFRKYCRYINSNIYKHDFKEYFSKTTYKVKENLYNLEYDWIISDIKSSRDNSSVKLKISLPKINFKILDKNIIFTKHISKETIINIFKSNNINWEKYVLYELFMNKKFRNIVSNANINNYYYNNNLIRLDNYLKLANNNNQKYYEFFITYKELKNSYFFRYHSYLLLMINGKTNKYFEKLQLSLKDSYFFNKFVKFWGFLGTLNKCREINKQNGKYYYNFDILSNISNDLYKILSHSRSSGNIINSEKFTLSKRGSINFINQANSQNIKKYTTNDIDIVVIEGFLSEIILNQIHIEIKYYSPPRKLFNFFLKEKDYKNKICNILCECSYNFLQNEEINIDKEEYDLKKKYGKESKENYKLQQTLKMQGFHRFKSKNNKISDKIKLLKDIALRKNNIKKNSCFTGTQFLSGNNSLSSFSKASFYKKSSMAEMFYNNDDDNQISLIKNK